MVGPMTTIVLMLILLTGPWLAAQAWARGRGGLTDGRAAAATGLALLFAFTAIGHFVRAADLVAMLPPWVPQREAIVFWSGVFEAGLAAAFLWPRTRRAAGLAACAALVLFFPVNVHAALHHTGMGGHADGPAYLLIRAPLQAVLLAWAWWFTVRRPPAGR